MLVQRAVLKMTPAPRAPTMPTLVLADAGTEGSFAAHANASPKESSAIYTGHDSSSAVQASLDSSSDDHYSNLSN